MLGTESKVFIIWTMRPRDEMTEINLHTTNEFLADERVKTLEEAYTPERVFKTTITLDSDSGLGSDFMPYYNPMVMHSTEEEGSIIA